MLKTTFGFIFIFFISSTLFSRTPEFELEKQVDKKILHTDNELIIFQKQPSQKNLGIALGVFPLSILGLRYSVIKKAKLISLIPICFAFMSVTEIIDQMRLYLKNGVIILRANKHGIYFKTTFIPWNDVSGFFKFKREDIFGTHRYFEIHTSSGKKMKIPERDLPVSVKEVAQLLFEYTSKLGINFDR